MTNDPTTPHPANSPDRPGRPGWPGRTVLRAGRILSFVAFFAWEFLKSNVTVLIEIFRLRPQARPAIVAVPLRGTRDVEIVSLANLISLTPGTLTLEVAQEPATLYVHGMFADDPAAFLADLAVLEDRMLAAMRPVGDPLARRRVA